MYTSKQSKNFSRNIFIGLQSLFGCMFAVRTEAYYIIKSKDTF